MPPEIKELGIIAIYILGLSFLGYGIAHFIAKLMKVNPYDNIEDAIRLLRVTAHKRRYPGQLDDTRALVDRLYKIMGGE